MAGVAGWFFFFAAALVSVGVDFTNGRHAGLGWPFNHFSGMTTAIVVSLPLGIYTPLKFTRYENTIDNILELGEVVPHNCINGVSDDTTLMPEGHDTY